MDGARRTEDRAREDKSLREAIFVRASDRESRERVMEKTRVCGVQLQLVYVQLPGPKIRVFFFFSFFFNFFHFVIIIFFSPFRQFSILMGGECVCTRSDISTVIYTII